MRISNFKDDTGVSSRAETSRGCKFSRRTACTLGVLDGRENAGALRMISYRSAVHLSSLSLSLSLSLSVLYFFVANLFQPYLRTSAVALRTEEVHLSASKRANFPVERSLKALGMSWDAFMTPG